MQTWWVPYQERHVAVVAHDAQAAAAYVGEGAGSPVALPDHPPCDRCPAREMCLGRAWDGPQRHLEESLGLEPKSGTFAHTCRTCMRKMLCDWRDKVPSIEVAEGCPRWSAQFGSALDCGNCRSERDDLRKAHPGYAARIQAAQDVMTHLFASVKARRDDGVEVLDTVRDRKRVSGEMAAATMPFAPPMAQALENMDKGLVEIAGPLLQKLVGVAHQHQPLQAEWHRLDELMQTMQLIEWLEGLLLAVTRHQRPAAVVHEWMLVFTDPPVVSRAWHRLSFAERKLLFRMWEGIVREALPERLLDEVPESGQPGSP